MGRWFSFVTTLGSEPSSLSTQILATPFLSGAIQATRAPSGDNCGRKRSALANRVSRGIRGGNSPLTIKALRIVRQRGVNLCGKSFIVSSVLQSRVEGFCTQEQIQSRHRA